MSPPKIRPAGPDDIPALLDLLDVATYGFIAHLFTSLSRPGADVRQVLASRMADPASQLFFGKAQVAETGERVAGFVMTEAIPDPPDLVGPDTPDLLRPLFELESRAPGTTLINFVATYPELRGHGIGTALLERAERSRGPNGMSLTIHDLNVGARQLYERRGYREVDRRPIVKQGWNNPASDWVLMILP